MMMMNIFSAVAWYIVLLLIFFYPENYFFLESNNDQRKTFNYFNLTVKSFLRSGKIPAKTVLILVGYIWNKLHIVGAVTFPNNKTKIALIITFQFKYC